MKQLDITQEEADRFYAAGNLAVTEAICRLALDKRPRESWAWARLGAVALDLGMPARAAMYSTRALELDPAIEGAAETLSAAQAAGAAARDGRERFILIKAWGNGFFSDTDHVLSGLLLAEMTGRTPVVCWGSHSRFTEPGCENAWDLYFEPVSPMRIGDLIGKGYRFYPAKWNEENLRQENLNKLSGPGSRLSGLFFLSRDEEVVVLDYHTGVPVLAPWLPPEHPMYGKDLSAIYRYLVKKYLRIRPEIQAEIEAFAGWNLPPGVPLVAAHVRGTDKAAEDPQLNQKIGVYPKAVDPFLRRQPGTRLLLVTDSEPLRQMFQNRYGPVMIVTDATRTSGQKGLHYLDLPRQRLGIDVIKDAYLAARCDYFVGLGSSNVSCMIYHLKEWTPENSLIIGPPMTHLLNPYLYMNTEQLTPYLPAEQVAKLKQMAGEQGASAAPAG